MLSRGRKSESLEFEAVIGTEGVIEIPRRILRSLPKGRPVHVRLTTLPLADELRARGIREEEIGRIAALQREGRDRVVAFLLSEGVLQKPAKKR